MCCQEVSLLSPGQKTLGLSLSVITAEVLVMYSTVQYSIVQSACNGTSLTRVEAAEDRSVGAGLGREPLD